MGVEELLVHVSGPSSRKDDNRYRAMAKAYNTFEASRTTRVSPDMGGEGISKGCHVGGLPAPVRTPAALVSSTLSNVTPQVMRTIKRTIDNVVHEQPKSASEDLASIDYIEETPLAIAAQQSQLWTSSLGPQFESQPSSSPQRTPKRLKVFAFDGAQDPSPDQHGTMSRSRSDSSRAPRSPRSSPLRYHKAAAGSTSISRIDTARVRFPPAPNGTVAAPSARDRSSSGSPLWTRSIASVFTSHRSSPKSNTAGQFSRRKGRTAHATPSMSSSCEADGGRSKSSGALSSSSPHKITPVRTQSVSTSSPLFQTPQQYPRKDNPVPLSSAHATSSVAIATPRQPPATPPIASSPLTKLPLSSQSQSDHARMPLAISPPPAPVGLLAAPTPQDLITSPLAQMMANPQLSRVYKPSVQTRPLKTMERGHWRFDTRGWEAQQQTNGTLAREFWWYLELFIGRGRGGWGIWCAREEHDEKEGREGGGSADDAAATNAAATHRLGHGRPLLGAVRVYCWGGLAPYVYLLLYVASKSRVKRWSARWVDAEGRTVITM